MMNEMNKGLRDLGGTKTVAQYTDIVSTVIKEVQAISDNNGINFQSNLTMYLEGLEEDVLDIKLPHTLGPIESQ